MKEIIVVPLIETTYRTTYKADYWKFEDGFVHIMKSGQSKPIASYNQLAIYVVKEKEGAN